MASEVFKLKRYYSRAVFTIIFIAAVALAAYFLFSVIFRTTESVRKRCFTGAFLADNPTQKDILSFQRDYGKKPYYVMVFIDWGNSPDKASIESIIEENCRPIVTWEPWTAHLKEGIDMDKFFSGGYDGYIREFASVLKGFEKEILLRFAHEMNGNWYPWSGSVIGAEQYKRMYRRVKDIFDGMGIDNVKWVFSINWEDIPGEPDNDMANFYPGGDYVDYTGLDGYNWGSTRSWSRWMTFYEIFSEVYARCRDEFGKPIIITEFSSVKEGGDKAKWIRQAMRDIKAMEKIEGFVVFNIKKEEDWSFPVTERYGREFRDSIADPYFADSEEYR